MTRFTDSYISYANEFTDCPDVFLLWGALLAISSSLSRSVYVQAGSWNVAPHIWPVLIGKSSSHKSTALSITEDLIESGDVDRMAPHEFTQEAIIDSLSKRSQRLFIFDEAKSFFDSMSKEYNNGLKSLFTILYRKPNYTRTSIKHGSQAIQQAYITMGLATTPEWFRQSIQDAEKDALSGFLSRFLMIPYMGKGNEPMALPPPHDPAKLACLGEMLFEYRKIEQVFHYTPDCREALDKWYRETTERENEALPILGPFFEHFKNEAIHKLCVLFAIDRGLQEITVEPFGDAVLCLKYIEDNLHGLMEDMTGTKWDKEHKRVKEIIKKEGSLDRTKLSRLTHFTGQHLTAHLTGLCQDGLITIEKTKTATKPVDIISWVGE